MSLYLARLRPQRMKQAIKKLPYLRDHFQAVDEIVLRNAELRREVTDLRGELADLGRDLKAKSFHVTVLQRKVASEPLKLILGASGSTRAGWFSTEQVFLDIRKDSDWSRFFEPASVDAMVSEHVWEHLSEVDGCKAAELCFRYLKPGGRLRIAVPDGNHPSPDYREGVRIGRHGHKVLFGHDSLGAMFRSVGFETELLEYFDADGQFHEQNWDPDDGMIVRSKRFDRRNRDGQLRCTSIIMDARRVR